jgi:hypothetical protein
MAKLHPADRALGYADGDEGHLQAFRANCRRSGMSNKQIEGLVRFGGDVLKRGVDLEEHGPAVWRELEQHMILNQIDVDVGDQLIGTSLGYVISGEAPPFNGQPNHNQDLHRRNELERNLSEDPTAWTVEDGRELERILTRIAERDAREPRSMSMRSMTIVSSVCRYPRACMIRVRVGLS